MQVPLPATLPASSPAKSGSKVAAHNLAGTDVPAFMRGGEAAGCDECIYVHESVSCASMS